MVQNVTILSHHPIVRGEADAREQLNTIPVCNINLNKYHKWLKNAHKIINFYLWRE